MNLAHQAKKILISGNSGSGKSTFATAVLLNSGQTYKFCFDHEGEIALRLGFAPASSESGLVDQLEQGWVIYDPGDGLEADDLADAFDWFCQWAFAIKVAINQENREAGRPFATALFFTDELQALIDPHNIPAGFRAILDRGRRQGIDTLLATQQPNVIHNRARNQITELVAFSQVDRQAVEFMADQGFDPDVIRGLPERTWQLINRRRRICQWGTVEVKPPRIVINGSKVFSDSADNDPSRFSTG